MVNIPAPFCAFGNECIQGGAPKNMFVGLFHPHYITIDITLIHQA